MKILQERNGRFLLCNYSPNFDDRWYEEFGISRENFEGKEWKIPICIRNRFLRNWMNKD